jgi:hypothetical protein
MNTKTNKKIMSIAVEVIVVVISIAGILLLTKMRAMAAGTGKNLRIGSAVLMPEMSDSGEYYDRDTKNRVTTAQTVYYGSNGTQKWLVIGYNGTGAVSSANTATLFAIDYMGTAKEYQAAGTSNSYVNSDIRKILIGESNENGEGGYYRDKFDNVEKTVILGRTLSQGGYGNPGSPDYIISDGISDSSNPVDKLWLLSSKEADLLKQDYRTASGWLRSPGDNDINAAVVFDNGFVSFSGYPVDDLARVRPAFNLNLQSIIFTSAAAGGKTSGTVGADALNPVEDLGGSTEWKFTIYDSSRSGFGASRMDSDTLTAGGTVEISYSGAKTGTGEYVSAIITDSSDTVLYYGNIASCTSASGTASINIPAGAPAGCKLYVFQEKCNGNYMTDYSSGLINLTAPGSSGVGAVAATPTQTSEETPEESEDIPEFNYLDPLEDLLDYAISLGGERTVYWRGGTALPSNIMKTLEENPQLTLVFSYTYEYKDYEVSIPGKKVKTDPKIPWYGPLYLYGHYGK